MRHFKLTSWVGLTVLAAVGLTGCYRYPRPDPLPPPPTANVVPNGGFEQGGCGNTPVICGWTSGDSMSQDTANPHSGHVSLGLGGACGFCMDTDFFSVAATSTSCIPLGPGAHAASFWYRDVTGDEVTLDANFYEDVGCTIENGSDGLGGALPTGSGWQRATGTLHAPTYTRAVRFSVEVGAWCSPDCPVVSANFDDVSVDGVGVAPTISSFSPTHGWMGVTFIEIYGFNFVGTTSVTFNGVPAQFAIWSDTEIRAWVPTGATSGPISVTTAVASGAGADGTAWSSSSFTVVPPPAITSFTPTTGSVGTTVDIRGTNFTYVDFVGINNTPAAFTVDSNTEIHATVPAGATGSGPIVVTAPEGSSFGYGFTVTP